MNRRFVGEIVGADGNIYHTNAASIFAFADKIFGRCPRCGAATIINGNFKYSHRFESAGLQCLNCTFYEDWSADKIYGKGVGTAKQPCPNCGAQWLSAEVRTDIANLTPDSVAVVCGVCGKTNNLALTWTQAVYYNQPLDPFFSRPLWLQTECVGRILWFYNEQHLEYVKSYIAADLRDDDGRFNWSIVSRLPKWFTAAKNRKSVMKAINKLEIAAAELQPR